MKNRRINKTSCCIFRILCWFIFFLDHVSALAPTNNETDSAAECKNCLGEEYRQSQTLAPSETIPPTDIDETGSSEQWGAIDILVAAFFLVAAGWLLLAILYSVIVLVLLRLQAQGELDFYDEDFGLVRIGNCIQLHFGCILRRYAIQLEREQQQRRQRQFGEEPRPVRIMTRDERRCAMEQLLAVEKDVSTSIPLGDADSDTSEGPICTICLAEYGKLVFARLIVYPI